MLTDPRYQLTTTLTLHLGTLGPPVHQSQKEEVGLSLSRHGWPQPLRSSPQSGLSAALRACDGELGRGRWIGQGPPWPTGYPLLRETFLL